MRGQPTISVIIPVKNGAATLAACLQSVREQSVPVSEIIVLDSGSKDGSKAIAEEFGARIIDIAPEKFNHGLTRNEAVNNAKGDLLFFTVQDARLSASDTLSMLAAHFEDRDVCAAGGHQAVPHEKDKNPVLWFKRYSTPVPTVRQIPVGAFFSMPLKEKMKLVPWDNVIAMYRRTALLSQPFAATQFAEDWIWSYEALSKGWKLVYDPRAVTYHYHHHDFRYSFRAQYTISYHLFRFFHYRFPLPSFGQKTAASLYAIWREPNLTILEKFYWSLHNLKANLGTWLSVLTFRMLQVLGGRQGIDKGYHWFCSKIPQGMLRTKASPNGKHQNVETAA